MPPRSVTGVLLVLVLLLAACAPSGVIRRAERVEDVTPPEFRVVSGQTRIERFNPPGAGSVVDLVVGTSVYNPNSFAVRLEQVDYTLSLAGHQVARATLETDMFLPPGGTSPLLFTVEAPLRDRPGLLASVVGAMAGEPLGFRIEGDMVFNSLAYEFHTNRRLLAEGTLLSRETVQPPRLRLLDAESEAYLLSADVPVVRLVIEASNPGDIGYFLYGKDLSLELAGQRVAMDDLRPVPLPGGTSSRIDLIFYPQRAQLAEEGSAALDAALAGIPTAVDVTGQLAMDVLGVDAFPVPEGWRVSGFIYRQGQ